MTAQQAYRDLSKLDDLGYFEREGSGLSTAYVRTEKQSESGHVWTGSGHKVGKGIEKEWDENGVLDSGL
jgi:hypothetical protein